MIAVLPMASQTQPPKPACTMVSERDTVETSPYSTQILPATNLSAIALTERCRLGALLRLLFRALILINNWFRMPVGGEVLGFPNSHLRSIRHRQPEYGH